MEILNLIALFLSFWKYILNIWEVVKTMYFCTAYFVA